MLRLQQAVKAGKQKAAKAAKVQLAARGRQLYPEPGTLRFADLAVDPSTGSVLLRAEFPNPRRELLPGTFARVRFPAGRSRRRDPHSAARGYGVAAGTGRDGGRCRRQGEPRPIKTGGMAGPTSSSKAASRPAIR
jgi:membrane fusion protein (multidrug efflux system)